MTTTFPFDLEAMQGSADEASRLLKPLANAQRLRVLCLLVGQELSVGQINERLEGLSQSALSQHLAKLRREGLVQTRRESQTIWYRLAEGPVERLIATLHDIYCGSGADEAPTRAAPRPRRRC
ncbi:MAG: metalloregulator ArsR/SmtB family transcription factor [Mizugakiibacter sp.]|uniref:ArsR/SmtB family transcription factor n=1 Tax=Mizugakiibacter sp. TaxID=1972610 RepID=UPI0031C5B4A2|nr:metalloregulator ArsR/SmtB family transcription factor [Xanthomonadaceae bacterium]